MCMDFNVDQVLDTMNLLKIKKKEIQMMVVKFGL
jgi:hypothetical protein